MATLPENLSQLSQMIPKPEKDIGESETFHMLFFSFLGPDEIFLSAFRCLYGSVCMHLTYF